MWHPSPLSTDSSTDTCHEQPKEVGYLEKIPCLEKEKARQMSDHKWLLPPTNEFYRGAGQVQEPRFSQPAGPQHPTHPVMVPQSLTVF